MSSTKRPVNPAAEAYLGEEFRVLDHGYIKLVDYMGTDRCIAAAARQSTQSDKNDNDEGNRKLITFLMRHRHTSPFEMAELKWEVKLPIFVMREWVRHRTASLNEMSGRYTQLPSEFFFPDLDRIARQSGVNKQGSAEPMDAETAQSFLSLLQSECGAAYGTYKYAITSGIAREIARVGLPLNIYTRMVWKCDLHNTLGFLKLRNHSAAQKEIRDYAKVMDDVIQYSFPYTWEAWVNHVRDARTLPEGLVSKLKELAHKGYGQQFMDAVVEELGL